MILLMNKYKKFYRNKIWILIYSHYLIPMKINKSLLKNLWIIWVKSKKFHKPQDKKTGNKVQFQLLKFMIKMKINFQIKINFNILWNKCMLFHQKMNNMMNSSLTNKQKKYKIKWHHKCDLKNYRIYKSLY